jgi:two-component system, LuxR family, sensor kinase FixL
VTDAASPTLTGREPLRRFWYSARGFWRGYTGALHGAQQVLVNLIRNTIEIMVETPNRRALEIATRSNADDAVEVSVADTGTGLAPEVTAQLFQPFVTTKSKGMGLGLSICETIVEAHGGRIWVESRPGGDTIFRFTLRAAKLEEPSLVE